MNCHEADLNAARDSHPKKKFTNPRNADLQEILDARYCITCHTEHQKEQTGNMGLTLPEDYCYHCHVETIEERESHNDLAFDSCATAGCHNFHDNRALYEDFLVEHANQPWTKLNAQIMGRSHASLVAQKAAKDDLTKSAEFIAKHPDIHQAVAGSPHAEANLSCASCHTGESKESNEWVEKPGIEACQTCHSNEVSSFTEGKHGMRLSEKLSQTLSPMTPEMGRLPFHSDAMDKELSCASCHDPHSIDVQPAKVESCLTCHNDEHSNAFKSSPHADLWQKELSGEAEPNTSVTCATCHMPRLKFKNKSKGVWVQHNQNFNLRPNEKMIRSVCLDCHSLEFSIDALADPDLIKTNFNGKPKDHIPSIDWALKRAK
jgi:hypothetical protein